MEYAKVDNGQVAQVGLPLTGVLKNGCSVSGYNLLPLEVLLEEGWLPLEDIQPEYNIETHICNHNGYDIQANKVVVLHSLTAKPISPKTEIEILKETVDMLVLQALGV